MTENEELKTAVAELRAALMPFVACWTNGNWDEVPHKHLKADMFMTAQKALRSTYWTPRD